MMRCAIQATLGVVLLSYGSAGVPSVAAAQLPQAVFTQTHTLQIPEGVAESQPLYRYGGGPSAVALGDDTALVSVGFPGPGAVLVLRARSGIWEVEDVLVPDPAIDPPGGLFGTQIRLSGDVAIVSHPSGAHVYRRTQAKWTFEARLSIEGGSASVAVGGDGLVITRGGIVSAGDEIAYVYRFDGVGWEREAILLAQTAAADWGHQVAMDEDTIVITARDQSPFGGFQEVSGHVFVRETDGWLYQAELNTFGADPDGSSRLTLSGDRVAIGTADGVAIFARNGGDWVAETQLASTSSHCWEPNPTCYCAVETHTCTSLIGPEVAIDGNSLVVPEIFIDWDGFEPFASGGLLLYDNSASTWSRIGSLGFPCSGQVAYECETWGLALNGSDALVLGSWATSSVDVYRRDHAWRKATTLSTLSHVGGRFGHSVGMNDSLAAVASGGAVSLFTRDDDGWRFHDLVTVVPTLPFRVATVAVADDELVVATDPLGFSLITRSADRWTRTQSVALGQEEPLVALGGSILVASAEDRLLVYDVSTKEAALRQELALPSEAVEVAVGPGPLVGATTFSDDMISLRLFEREGETWAPQPVLSLPQDAPQDAPVSLALGSSLVIAGQPAPSQGCGRVFAFERTDIGWKAIDELPAPSCDDEFGRSVVISNGRAFVVGRNGVVVFERLEGSWARRASLARSHLEDLAVRGDEILVGVPQREAASVFALSSIEEEPDGGVVIPDGGQVDAGLPPSDAGQPAPPPAADGNASGGCAIGRAGSAARVGFLWALIGVVLAVTRLAMKTA